MVYLNLLNFYLLVYEAASGTEVISKSVPRRIPSVELDNIFCN